jgi:Ca2+-binding RTX toxin-like protein
MSYRRPLPKSAIAKKSDPFLMELDDEVVITSGDGGDTATINLYENHMGHVAWVQATGSGTITYSIAGGADAALFTINSSSGVLDFAWPFKPDYEAPADADGNNSYLVIVEASNGVDSDQQALTVNAYNVNEAPVFTSYGGLASTSTSVAENNVIAAVFAAVDPEGFAMLNYAIVGGADAALFTVNPWNGALAFRAAPNFEAPADAGLNNVYDVTVRATDGLNTVTQALAITLTDVGGESVVTGTASSNTLTGGAGTNDVIYGLGGIDTISGLAGDDLLDGGAGNDTLVGGAGADRLLGGASGDTFRYDAAGDSAVGSHDFLYDFSRSQSDRIHLTGVDANTLVGGDQAFSFLGTGAFTSAAGQLRYEKTGGNTFVYGDLDGDAVADFMLQINGETSLFSSDFYL